MYSDLLKQPLGMDKKGNKVFLKTSADEPRDQLEVCARPSTKQMFAKKYADVFKGDSRWRGITVKRH